MTAVPPPSATRTRRPACYGFAIRSPRSFAYARDGGGEQDLHVVADGQAPTTVGPMLTAWRLDPHEPVRARLYAAREGSYDLWIRDAGWFHVDTGRSRLRMPVAEGATRAEERLWGIPALLCMQAQGHLPLHAAAIEVGGAAVLLAAPSRHGKTTLAAAAAAAGARLLAEDLACIRVDDGPAVLPGPAMLRLRHDVVAAVPVPGTRVAAPADDRVHLALQDPGDGRPVPLSAVVLLRPGDGPPRLERVPATDTLSELWSLSWHVPTSDAHGRCFQQLADLTDRVAVFELRRPLRFDALPDAVASVLELGAHV